LGLRVTPGRPYPVPRVRRVVQRPPCRRNQLTELGHCQLAAAAAAGRGGGRRGPLLPQHVHLCPGPCRVHRYTMSKQSGNECRHVHRYTMSKQSGNEWPGLVNWYAMSKQTGYVMPCLCLAELQPQSLQRVPHFVAVHAVVAQVEIESKVESVSSYRSFKRWNHRRFCVSTRNLILSTCTALPWARRCGRPPPPPSASPPPSLAAPTAPPPRR